MRWFPNIGYGTGGYPEKTARRLRAVTITAWAVALGMLSFTIRHIADPDPISVLTIAILLATPLLLRLGELAAVHVLLLLVFAQIFRISLTEGTDGGADLGFLAAAPLSVLLFGIGRAWVAAFWVAAAAVLGIWINTILPDNTGIVPDDTMKLNYGINFTMTMAIAFTVVLFVARQADKAEAAAEREYRRAQLLLENILPPKIAERLKERGSKEVADSYLEASVLFADMAGFTALAGAVGPEALVRFLNDVYTRIDELVERHSLEKIKTSGDSYIVVAGVPEPLSDHAARLADFALDMRDSMSGLLDPQGNPVSMRVGIASGPVVAGVVGTRKFFYDVWGDTVNTASRMESTGISGQIQVDPVMGGILADRFNLEERGVTDIRGKGAMRTWFLVGRKPGSECMRPGPL